MSVEVMSWVFKHSQAKLGKRLVLLALADYAHDDGTKAFPAVETLAKKALVSERQTQRLLKELMADGAIKLMGHSGKGTKIWQVVMTEDAAKLRGGAILSGVTSATDPVQEMSPNPSGNRQLSEGSESARAGIASVKRLKFNGKPVDPQLWMLTVQILEHWNVQLGKTVAPITGSGEISQNAKRIYGRVREHPDLKLAEHIDIISRTLASKWWGDSEPSIGVVYGPRVFEDNITRQPTTKQSKKAEAEERTRQDMEALKRLTGRSDDG